MKQIDPGAVHKLCNAEIDHFHLHIGLMSRELIAVKITSQNTRLGKSIEIAFTD